VQLHFLFVSVHVVVVQPNAEKTLPAFSQVTATDEMDRQASSTGNVAEPVVRVLSVYVPSALATKVPVVPIDPVIGTVGHARLSSDTSRLPDSFKQDDATFHVPTTFPPQADTLVQLAIGPEPLTPLAPAVLPAPAVLLPAPPAGVSALMLHPAPAPSATHTDTPKNIQ